jgi:hypothetical protein
MRFLTLIVAQHANKSGCAGILLLIPSPLSGNRFPHEEAMSRSANARSSMRRSTGRRGSALTSTHLACGVTIQAGSSKDAPSGLGMIKWRTPSCS